MCTVGPLLVCSHGLEVIVMYFHYVRMISIICPFPSSQDVVTRDAARHLGDPHPSYHPRDERVAGSFKPSPLTSIMPSLDQDQGPLENAPTFKEMQDGPLVTVTTRGKFQGETENDTNLPNSGEIQTCPVCNEHVVRDMALGINHIVSCKLDVWKEEKDDVTA